MKSKILLIVPLAVLALSIVASVRAAEPALYAELQLEITGFIPIGPGQFDVPFEGVAGGPNIKEGTVVGVDHLVIDGAGIGHIHAYMTVTDKDGDKISAYYTGLSIHKNPGQIVHEDTWATIIDELDYPTTGKYDGLVGITFRGESFISDFSSVPPGGYIHVKLYWQ